MNVFRKYVLLGSLAGRIETRTPLRIGKGKAEKVTEADLPIIKSHLGIPIIPGSSLKGFFRGNAYRLLLSMTSEEKSYLVEKFVDDVFGGMGEGKHASLMLFYDIRAEKFDVDIRKHIKINPETGGVQNLFEVEYVSENSVFKGRMVSFRNVSPAILSILEPISELPNLGIARLGGFKSRGYGVVKIYFEKLELILPGISIQEIEKGQLLTVPIGTGQEIYIKKDDSQVIIKELAEVRIKAEVATSPEFFGTRIVIADEELQKLMKEFVIQLQRYLETSWLLLKGVQ